MGKISHCEFCGDDLGQTVDKQQGEIVTCGKAVCEGWARDEELAAREKNHEEQRQLDHDMGWF